MIGLKKWFYSKDSILFNLLFMSLLISGCTTVDTGEKFKPLEYEPEDKATLYIYRPEANFNWGGWAEIFIDDQLKTSLLNNSYLIVYLEPGEHTVKAEGTTWGTNWYPGPVEREFSFRAGTSYYLRIRPVQIGSTHVQNTLTESALTNAVLGAAITSAVGNLPKWPTAITLMEMMDPEVGRVEIQETQELVNNK